MAGRGVVDRGVKMFWVGRGITLSGGYRPGIAGILLVPPHSARERRGLHSHGDRGNENNELH
jgi:hypothetical protein